MSSLQTECQRLNSLAHGVLSLGEALLGRLLAPLALSGDMPADARLLAHLLGDPGDLVRRAATLEDGRGVEILYLASLTDARLINTDLLGALSAAHPTGNVAEAHPVATYGEAVGAILAGSAVVLAGGGALALEAKGYEHRGVEAPSLETVVRGPHEAFNEDLLTNISLVRRRLRDPRLTFEPMTVGALSRTPIRLCYVRGLTNDALLGEVRRRLLAVRTDIALDTNYLAEAMADQPYTVFPTTDFTERPDVVVGALAEGRFAILVDGTPNAIVAPVTFWSFLQAPDDYYQSYVVASFLRWLRYLFFFLALLAPALYIAVTTFHQQMIPSALLISLARGRQNLPLPAVGEAVVMEVSLEILREAALHLPTKLGTSLSVVGALVIGQAAVSSGLVSWPIVVIVSVTAIADFAIPRWSMALSVRLLRFSEMIGAAVFGLPGILVVSTLMLTHMVALRSFGLPYFYPLAPYDATAIQDVVMRPAHWAPRWRPKLLSPYWRLRRPPGRRPRPPRQAGRGAA